VNRGLYDSWSKDPRAKNYGWFFLCPNCWKNWLRGVRVNTAAGAWGPVYRRYWWHMTWLRWSLVGWLHRYQKHLVDLWEA
jgi:hypothetical protein